MKTHLSRILKVGVVAGFVFGLTACSEPTQVQEQAQLASFDANKFPVNKLVCNPMGGDVPTADNGLQANLFYVPKGQPRYYKVMDYINNGVSSEQYLFYSQVNVPTRLFSLGFPREIGGMVTDDAGDDLVEFFALQFKSNMKLDSQDEEGYYQLAILSDDGAILYDNTNPSAKTTLVDSDGDHPTRFGCGATVNMTRAKSLPIELNYYQGPRTEIAVTMMWRKVDSADAAKDAYCGLTGNSTFFDYMHGSTPTQKYKDLLARGWKPLKQTNYSIKETSEFNPCAQGLVPVITNVALEEIAPGSIRVTWNTDILATSQVRIVDVAAGTELLTNSDNLMRRSHSVVVNNVALGMNLMAQAVSISETFGKGLSTGVNFRLE